MYLTYHTFMMFYIKIFNILAVAIFHKQSFMLWCEYVQFYLSFYSSIVHQVQDVNKYIFQVHLFWRTPVRKHMLLAIYITLNVNCQISQNEHTDWKYTSDQLRPKKRHTDFERFGFLVPCNWPDLLNYTDRSFCNSDISLILTTVAD